MAGGDDTGDRGTSDVGAGDVPQRHRLELAAKVEAVRAARAGRGLPLKATGEVRVLHLQMREEGRRDQSGVRAIALLRTEI